MGAKEPHARTAQTNSININHICPNQPQLEGIGHGFLNFTLTSLERLTALEGTGHGNRAT